MHYWSTNLTDLSEIKYRHIFLVTEHKSILRIENFFFPRWRIQDGGPLFMDKSTKDAKNEILN